MSKSALRWSEEQAADYFRRRGRELSPEEKKKATIERKVDANANELARQVRISGMSSPVLEYVFAAPRKWRFDLCWPDFMLACEVDGAVHRIKERFKSDLEKHQHAFLQGWAVLRVAPRQVRSGEALALVEAALTAYGTVRKR